MTTLTYQGRLPGVGCVTTLPTGPQPIRLDVPAFVGFAERGPLSQPTPVEDFNQYQAVFGGDLVLAQNAGVPVYASLPASVKSFFDNGGLRCYVVRVAGPKAQAARWLVPGLRQWLPDGTVQDVYVGAAWPGGWSVGLEVGTQLLQQPLAVAGGYQPAGPGSSGKLSLTAASALAVLPGDLIRLDFGPSWPELYLSAARVDVSWTSTGIGTGTVTGGAEVPVLLGPAVPLPGPVPVAAATLLRLDLVIQQLPAGGGSAQQLEEWLNLSFNPPGAACWLQVTQQAEVPDLTRSMLLRADPSTVAVGGVFVPVGMDEVGTSAEFTDATAGSPPYPGVLAGDDDLSTFDPVAVFLDPRLLLETTYDLIEDAHGYTELSPDPVALTGIHSLIDTDEVAMICVPDAAQLGWTPSAAAPPPAAAPPSAAPVPPVDWSDFRACALPPAPPAPPPPPAAVPPTPLPYPVQDDPASYQSAGLLTVQTALVTLCAARADAVAVLSLPQHYRTADVLTWSQQLTGNTRISGSPLSFAAVWYPWVQVVEPATPQLAPLRPLPPDGPAAGTIAARENARGVWVAAAGLPLRGIVGLTPALAAGDQVALFNAHGNLFVRQPGAFTALSAHTLSADPSLLQLSVRRLLILLRKIALQRGMRYVFATNSDRFRQMVRRSFERLLTDLARRGALNGFQVITAGAVNTPADIASGRLIVQLLVAPANAVEFITVTLVRAGEGLLNVLEGTS